MARATCELDPDMVDRVDRWLSQTAVANPNAVTSVEIAKAIASARAHGDPDYAEAKAAADRGHRHVTLHPRLSGRGVSTDAESGAVTDVSMLLDASDAQVLDNALAQLAATLGDLGDTDSLDIRRAKSVGILTDPQRAIDILSRRDTDTRPRTSSGGAVLYLHLNATDPRVVDAERHGALTLATIRDWLIRLDLAGSRLTVKPVLDLTDPATLTTAVTPHDPPAWMRDAAYLRDATCIFPGCTRDSRACDLDHRLAYVHPDEHDPPGQTYLDNLGPLCRHHHRLKTHRGWTWQRTAENTYRWTTPDGYVLHSRTHRRHH